MLLFANGDDRHPIVGHTRRDRLAAGSPGDPGDLIAPVLIAAFDGWVDAGSAATTALEGLLEDAVDVATFDPDALFDYRARRPTLQIIDGRLAELTWTGAAESFLNVNTPETLIAAERQLARMAGRKFS